MTNQLGKRKLSDDNSYKRSSQRIKRTLRSRQSVFESSHDSLEPNVRDSRDDIIFENIVGFESDFKSNPTTPISSRAPTEGTEHSGEEDEEGLIAMPPQPPGKDDKPL